MRTLSIIIALLVFLPHLMATCPSQCVCEARESEFKPLTYGIVFNCSEKELTDTNITNGFTSRIIHLDLSSNRISEINQSSFENTILTEVEEINLSNNTIHSINIYAFVGLEQLRSLNLANNNIRTIEHNQFYHNTKLSFLDLSKNTNISLPSDGFAIANSSLAWLDLSHCGLEKLPKEFFNYTKTVEYIYLSYNNLTHIDPHILKTIAPSVSHFDLFANALTAIQPELLQLLPLSCKLYLYGNPFKCDCDFISSYSLYKQRPFSMELNCRTPDRKWALRPAEVKAELNLSCTDT